jgi:nucleotide-binding universal stress UspA family protein
MEPKIKQGSTVLVALDGSPAAATALPIAQAVAAQLGVDLMALHIVSGGWRGGDSRHQLHPEHVTVEGIGLWPAHGDPVAAILQAAADPRVALVVLTTHGHMIEPGRHLGHVAESVIAGTTQPILLVRPEVAADFLAHRATLQHLLLPLDGTPTTAILLRPATALASRLGATVDLLYVAAPGQRRPQEPGSLGAPCYVDQPQHEWRHWANEFITRFCIACARCPSDVPVHMFLAQGEIGTEIVRFAAEQQVDAVVLARRSRLEPGHAQVLRTVLDHTPCPILLVGNPVTATRVFYNGRGRSYA